MRFLLGLILFAALPARAQTGAFNLSVSTAADPLGNSYVVSPVSANNQSFIQIRKISPQGQLAWTRNFSAGSLSIPAGIAVDGAGGVYVAGNDVGLAASFLLKFSADGVFISSQPTPNQGTAYWPFLAGLAWDPATGSLYTAETFLDPNHGGSASVLVLEYGADLSLAASQTINDGPGLSDEAAGVSVDAAGDVFVPVELLLPNDAPLGSQNVEFSPRLAAVVSRQGAGSGAFPTFPDPFLRAQQWLTLLASTSTSSQQFLDTARAIERIAGSTDPAGSAVQSMAPPTLRHTAYARRGGISPGLSFFL